MKGKAVAVIEDTRKEIVENVIEMMSLHGMEWTSALQGSCMVRNYASGKPYRGANRFRLAWACAVRGWTDLRFLTYAQAKKAGLAVRKGEHGTVIEHWKKFPVYRKKSDERDEATQTRENEKDDRPDVVGWTLRPVGYWTVFNVEQCDGEPEPWKPAAHADDDLQSVAETVVAASPCPVSECGTDVACYIPSYDEIRIFPRAQSDSVNGWIRTLLHEEGHATGAPSRLGRKLGGKFGSEDYAREELVAELCSVFLADELALPACTDVAGGVRKHMEDHAAYLKNWIACLQETPDFLFKAAAKAEAAADLIASAWRPADPEEGDGEEAGPNVLPDGQSAAA